MWLVSMYDSIIIGGGIAGLQGAIQLGRYKHRVLVIDANDGRSAYCHKFHNVLGYPEGVSGPELREAGRQHARTLGAEFIDDKAVSVEQQGEIFSVETESGRVFEGRTLFITTGIVDRIPPFPELMPCLGISVYVCPDCDGYEVSNQKTIVMGAGNSGAGMALIISYWTDDIIYVNHEKTEVDAGLLEQLAQKGIEHRREAIANVYADGPDFQGIELESGEVLKAKKGFLSFGGNTVNSGLAKDLGVELHENKHILVDPRTKMTNVKNVWAGGDVVAHSEQVTIAMADGSQAGIWIHKTLIAEKD